VDVGGGTGFCTLGVVERVRAENVTLIDQSPHQLAKARAKPQLKGVTILEVGGTRRRPTRRAPSQPASRPAHPAALACSSVRRRPCM
jgi:hypothetical protein